MEDNHDKFNELIDKLNALLKKQESFSIEVNKLKKEIFQLKEGKGVVIPEDEKVVTPVPDPTPEFVKEPVITGAPLIKQATSKDLPKQRSKKFFQLPEFKSDLEKFVGENLINKIGIVITIIGVAIGAKYSIDNDLISPLTRIILGYLAGVLLLGFGMKLKAKYENYSAVLVSGAMAIMYFITYAAFSFYDLIPQVIAFGLMVIFTAFTAVAALNYNKQVIALIGLVGAYAVPFLLSQDSGQAEILFGYVAIINIGILIIAFLKYWKPLYYAAFILTWAIYFLWYTTDFRVADDIGLALTFLSIFFITFYLIFLAYKLIKKKNFEFDDVMLLLTNSFIFFGIGYEILSKHDTGEQLLGVFTLGNAVVHFIVSLVIYREKLADRQLFYLVSGLVLVFITIAIPVQLDGNWVTLLWAGEAALLFWIGRTKNVRIYENISYALMILAFLSIGQDWSTLYNQYDPGRPETRLTPLLNTSFLSSVLFIAAFAFINWLNRNKNYASPLENDKGILSLASFFMPAILLIGIYGTFAVEIQNYWDQLYLDSAITTAVEGESYSNYYNNYDLRKFKTVWMFNYTLFFLGVLSFLNIKKLKNKQLGILNLVLNVLVIFSFLMLGLFTLSELRESYLAQTLAEYYQRGIFHLGLRYISFGLVAGLLYASYRYIREEFMNMKFISPFDYILHIAIIWMISSELLHWMDIAGSSQSHKLGLSIFWGSYSLLLVAYGIWKNKKHIRIGAIALFAVTLIKLFFYDIAHLNTIAKTIVFVSLGILLLIISFLYNKYNIFDQNED